jgi:hypothetical protein
MITRLLLIFTLSWCALATSGCFDTNPDDQELPWSRPADWEGGVPGFGG